MQGVRFDLGREASDGQVDAVAFSPDGRLLHAVCSNSDAGGPSSLFAIDCKRRTKVSTKLAGDIASPGHLLRVGRKRAGLLLTAWNGHSYTATDAWLIDMTTGQVRARFDWQGNELANGAFSADGSLVCLWDGSRELRLFDLGGRAAMKSGRRRASIACGSLCDELAGVEVAAVPFHLTWLTTMGAWALVSQRYLAVLDATTLALRFAIKHGTPWASADVVERACDDVAACFVAAVRKEGLTLLLSREQVLWASRDVSRAWGHHVSGDSPDLPTIASGKLTFRHWTYRGQTRHLVHGGVVEPLARPLTCLASPGGRRVTVADGGMLSLYELPSQLDA